MKGNDLVHILNGEGTAYSFRQSGLPGDSIVWNEALVDGPVSSALFSDQFLNDRRGFFDSVDQEAKYDFVFLSEFRKLEKLNGQTLCLWFEYDLFCQVNLIAALTSLRETDINEVYLVSPDSHPNHKVFGGLGQLSPTEIADLYPDRVKLSGYVLEFATELWNCYAGEDPLSLYELIFAEDHPKELPFLKSAFLEHFRRFPSEETGLNYVQEQIMRLVLESNDYKDVMRSLFRNNRNLGYGDLQYLSEIELLGEFIRKRGDHLEIVAEPTFNQSIKISTNRYVGGAPASRFLWNENSKSLKARP